MANGLALAGIGYYLGIITKFMPIAYHAGPLAQSQDLNKQPLDGHQGGGGGSR